MPQRRPTTVVAAAALTNELVQVVTSGLEQAGADTTVRQDNVEVDDPTPELVSTRIIGLWIDSGSVASPM
jgi:hypothetical protein